MDSVTPYADDDEYLLDELRRIDLLLYAHLVEWRANTAGTDEGVPGLYISDAEVDRLLRPDRPRTDPEDEELRRRIDDLEREIAERRRATAAAGTELRLPRLADRFDLGSRAVDALLLALAPEFDRKYEKVYGYLQDDITETRPTVGLVLRVLTTDERARIGARGLFSRSAPLVRDALVRLSPPQQDAPLLSHEVVADQRVVEFVQGSDAVDPRLGELVDVVDPDASVESLPVDPDARATVAELAPESAAPVMRYVHGPYGVGKTAAVEAMATRSGTDLLRVDADALARSADDDPLGRLRREARLRDCAVHVAAVEELRDGRWASVDAFARELDRFPNHVFLSGEDDWTLRGGLDRHEFAPVHLPRPGYSRRRELWNRHADVLPDELAASDVAAKFQLTSGQIEDAIDSALARTNGGGLTPEAVYRGCRTQSRETLGTLARRADPTYGWDDIVLPDDELEQLREVAAHVKHRGRVYDDWGFADRFGLGNGLNVLFSGPSGTGKTMAAEIIAGDAGLDMFKIDLASVVSKYIGETEENLKRVFDEAEHTDAVLFFDEADALFGERSEVSDSQDRYANVEVSYLLQRMEEHDGTVILASNYKENIDDAFLRRINLNVEFPRPGPDARAEIWRTIFPDDTPTGELDLPFLASFELTGGNIKNVVLTASFLAAEDDARDSVEMAHVVRALRRELQKTGRLVNPEAFGEYREFVQRGE